MRRVDKRIIGSTERPRLTVHKTLKNLYAQIIDDSVGKTLIGISSLTLEKGRGNKEVAALLGEKIAKEAVKLGVKKVVFDRGQYIYHGRIKAVADAARQNGLEF